MVVGSTSIRAGLRICVKGHGGDIVLWDCRIVFGMEWILVGWIGLIGVVGFVGTVRK